MKGYASKEANRLKVVEYIGNPDNEFPTRTQIALDILGYNHKESFYSLFTREEMSAMEEEGLALRKDNSKRLRSNVYDALYRQAESGNVQAIKEYLDRLEGKVIDRKEISGKDGKELRPILNVNLTTD